MKFFDFNKVNAVDKHMYFLFIDAVGFSTKDRETQLEIFQLIQRAAAEALRISNVKDEEYEVLLTGDGYCVTFHGSGLALKPLEFAREILGSLGRTTKIQLRVGIDAGPSYLVTSHDGQRQIIGPAINRCARILNSAEPNEILLHESYYDDNLQLTSNTITYGIKNSQKTIIAKHNVEINVRSVYWENGPGLHPTTDPPA